MNKSFLRNTVIGYFVAGILIFGNVYAGNKVNAKLHPNLAAAQSLIKRAKSKISAAQVANEFDMKGHAAKAKELLDQAYVEIKLAAQTANENKK